MSKSPRRPVDVELELYRAIMNDRIAALRLTAPDLSIPAPRRLSDAPHWTASDAAPRFSPPTRGGRILVVEDETILGRAYQRTLELNGLEPILVADAASALCELRTNQVDVVVSDILLPDHSGLDLLRHVRNCDPDLPMVLVTGTPDLDGAINAVALGAFRYLVKPVSNDRLLGCIAQAQRSRHVAKLREETLSQSTTLEGLSEGDVARAFERALEPLWMAFQPIVRWPCRTLYGYQALARSDEPSLALPTALLAAAQRLGRVQDLSRAVHRSVAKTARGLPPGRRVFVSTSADDLMDTELYSRTSPLGGVASRITLDVLDRQLADGPSELRKRVARLRAMGYRIAINLPDSLAANRSAYERVEADVIKVQVAPRDSRATEIPSRHALAQLAEWCGARGLDLVVEGVERSDERSALASTGCRLFQDCFFTQPDHRSSER